MEWWPLLDSLPVVVNNHHRLVVGYLCICIWCNLQCNLSMQMSKTYQLIRVLN